MNYGSSDTNEAAYAVGMFNVTNHCNFKYWEVGNEIFGTWETDNNTNAPYQAHDPWTYAMRFKDYYTQMKAVDPTIKIGAVIDPTEDGYANYTNHPVVNPRTGVTHNGWTPVMLTYMRSNNCHAGFRDRTQIWSWGGRYPGFALVQFMGNGRGELAPDPE